MQQVLHSCAGALCCKCTAPKRKEEASAETLVLANGSYRASTMLKEVRLEDQVY